MGEQPHPNIDAFELNIQHENLQIRWPSGENIGLWRCRFGFASESAQPMTVKLVFTASLLDVQHQSDCVKNKPASLLFMPLRKRNHLAGFPHLKVVNRWPATFKRAPSSALLALSRQDENIAIKYTYTTEQCHSQSKWKMSLGKGHSDIESMQVARPTI